MKLEKVYVLHVRHSGPPPKRVQLVQLQPGLDIPIDEGLVFVDASPDEIAAMKLHDDYICEERLAVVNRETKRVFLATLTRVHNFYNTPDIPYNLDVVRCSVSFQGQVYTHEHACSQNSREAWITKQDKRGSWGESVIYQLVRFQPPEPFAVMPRRITAIVRAKRKSQLHDEISEHTRQMKRIKQELSEKQRDLLQYN